MTEGTTIAPDAKPRLSPEQAVAAVEEVLLRHQGRIVIDAVVPGYHARLPEPCVGGWGRCSINVTPSGKVLPCHAAESIPGLEFWNVRDRSLAEVWAVSPAFNAFRGTDFLPQPCASCEQREIDFGGCRSQAFLLTGNPRATDPVCHKSPVHDIVARAAEIHADTPYHYRADRSPTWPRPRCGRPAKCRTLDRRPAWFRKNGLGKIVRGRSDYAFMVSEIVFVCERAWWARARRGTRLRTGAARL